MATASSQPPPGAIAACAVSHHCCRDAIDCEGGCSRKTSLRDVELAQGELAKALDSVELQQMVGWLATQYQRLASKSEAAGQYAASVGALNALRAMIVQPQIDRQFEAHFRGRHLHQAHRR